MAQHPDFLGESNESLHDNLERSEPGMIASYRLIGSIVVLGGLGYFLDRWLDTSPWLLIVGLAAGLVIGFAGLAGIALRGRVR